MISGTKSSHIEFTNSMCVVHVHVEMVFLMHFNTNVELYMQLYRMILKKRMTLLKL